MGGIPVVVGQILCAEREVSSQSWKSRKRAPCVFGASSSERGCASSWGVMMVEGKCGCGCAEGGGRIGGMETSCAGREDCVGGGHVDGGRVLVDVWLRT